MGLSPEAISDLIQSTLPSLPVRGEMEAALSKQRYSFIDYILKPHRRKRQSGTSVSLRVQLSQSGLARMVQLYEPTDNVVTDNISEIKAHWCFSQRKIHWERHEFQMNMGRAQIVDLLMSRRLDAARDMADLIEDQAWGVPDDATDDRNAFGVPYWINPMDAGTEAYEPDFVGQTVRYADDSTATVVGSIDKALAENVNWRNLAATYNRFNLSAIEQLSLMIEKLRFYPPAEVRKHISGYTEPTYGIYSDQNIFTQYRAMVNSGGDDRNGDLAPYAGSIAYQRIPWHPTPALNNDPIEPIYLLDHSKFFPVVNEWMAESDPIRGRDQPNVWTVAIDCWFQFVCANCRAGGAVLHKPIAA
jgi:hypothetical protein